MRTKRYKHFDAVRMPPEHGRVTHSYQLVNCSSNDTIGHVQWYGPWRQFCFFPEATSVWSDSCLSCVRDVIAWATQQRQLERGKT